MRRRSAVPAKRSTPSPRSETAARPASRSAYRLAEPLVCLGLLFLAFVAFGELLSPEFTFFNIDDDEYITANPHVRTGLSWTNFTWAVTAFHSNNWHPLTWLSLQIDVTLFGIEPAGFRFTNIVLHATTAILLFLFLRWTTDNLWPSALVAGLFLVHPLRVESVAWIAERKDVLAGLFWMLTLLAYARYVRRPGVWPYLLVLVVFVLGLSAKQMLVTLPVVLVLLDWWPFGRLSTVSWKRLALEKVPLLVLALGAGVLTLLAQTRVEHTLETLSLRARILNALVAYWRYIGKSLWPNDLCFLYLHPGDQTSWLVGLTAGIGLLTVTGFVLSSWARQRPYLAVGWLWFVLTLLPVIGLIQVGNQAMADRYSYIPQIGLWVMLVWTIADGLKQAGTDVLRYLLIGAAVVAIGILTVLTWLQATTWRDPFTVWSHVAKVEPSNHLAHNNLGQLFADAGQFAEAEQHILRAISAHPGFVVGYWNLGTVRQRKQDWKGAAEAFEQGLRLQPDHFEMRRLLARAYLIERRYAEAEKVLRELLEKQPGDINAGFYLAYALARKGQNDEADQLFRQRLKLASDWPAAMAQGAWLLATHPDESRRNGSLALFQAEAALRALQAAGRPPDADVLEALAAATAACGDFDAAVRHQSEALRLPNLTPERKDQMEKRLRMYTRKRL